MQGEILKYDNLLFTIVKSEGPRLRQIHIQRKPSSNYDIFGKNANSSGDCDDMNMENNYDGE